MLGEMYDITDDNAIPEEIAESYLYNKGHSIDTDYLRIKLHLNKRDDTIYHVLLDNNASTFTSGTRWCAVNLRTS